MIDEQTIQQWEDEANKHCGPDCCADNKRILALIEAYRESQAELKLAKDGMFMWQNASMDLGAQLQVTKELLRQSISVIEHGGPFVVGDRIQEFLKLDSPTEMQE